MRAARRAGAERRWRVRTLVWPRVLAAGTAPAQRIAPVRHPAPAQPMRLRAWAAAGAVRRRDARGDGCGRRRTLLAAFEAAGPPDLDQIVSAGGSISALSGASAAAGGARQPVRSVGRGARPQPQRHRRFRRRAVRHGSVSACAGAVSIRAMRHRGLRSRPEQASSGPEPPATGCCELDGDIGPSDGLIRCHCLGRKRSQPVRRFRRARLP